MSSYPVAPKVTASAVTAGGSGAVVGLVVALLSAGLPAWAIVLIVAVSALGPGLLTFLAGYRAPHQDRRDPKVPWQHTE